MNDFSSIGIAGAIDDIVVVVVDDDDVDLIEDEMFDEAAECCEDVTDVVKPPFVSSDFDVESTNVSSTGF